MFAGQTQAENAIDKSVARATSDAVRSSTSSQDLLSAITKINEGEMDKRNDLMEYASQDYLKRQGDLIKAKNDYANWQLEKQDRDVYDRFARDSSAASALKNAYMRNRYNGVQGTVGGVMDVATSLIPAVL
jgi:hypothetical protein